MKIDICIPRYDGGWIDVFWSANARFEAKITKNRILISGNAEAFSCFAKQMLYFCFNDMPEGTHIHYDSFFCKTNCLGLEFVIGLRGDESSEMWSSGEFIGEMTIEVPDRAGGVAWDRGAEAAVAYSYGQVILEGNRRALCALARQLLSLANSGKVEAGCPSAGRYSRQVKGWTGKPLEFRLLTVEKDQP